MRKYTLSLLSGLFIGFASYAESSKCNPLIGDDSQKGPPGMETKDLAYLNGADRPIANNETCT